MQISPNLNPTVAPQKTAPKAPTGVKTAGISASPRAQRNVTKTPAPKRRPKTKLGSAAYGSTAGTTKQDRVLSMLRRKDGISIAAVMKATGWQRHSVHGFFAGVVRGKLKLKLQTDGSGTKRVYHIGVGKRATAGKSKRRDVR